MGRPDTEAVRAAVEKHDRGGEAAGQGTKDKAARAAGAAATKAREAMGRRPTTPSRRP